MSSSTRTTSTRSCRRADIPAVADRDPPRPSFLSAIGARQGRGRRRFTEIVPWRMQPPKSAPAPLTFAKSSRRILHPLWDRYKRITPMQPRPTDTPFHWPWRATEEFLHRAVAEVPIEDIERRALIMSHPCFGDETATTGDHARRLHRARSGRAGPPPSPHRRCYPICNPGRRRRHPRQRPLVRHEDRRSDPDTADGVARPYQSEQEPDRLVRRRQHAAAARAQRAFLRAGRSEERGFLEGGRRRRTSLARCRTCGCQCPDRSAQFTEISLSGRSRPARCWAR